MGDQKPYRDRGGNASRGPDRRGFFLRTLCAFSLELSALEETQSIIDTCLLTFMGTLGITKGFIFLVETESLASKLSSRGLGEDEIRGLRARMPQIVREYVGNLKQVDAPSSMNVRLIARDGLPDNPHFPHDTKVLIQWSVEKELVGFIGMGSKIVSENYDDEDIEFLTALTNTMVVSIKNARSMEMILKLNLELREKNVELERSIKQIKITQKESERRVFHLKVLYDTTRELSDLKSTEKIMESFLLMSMGTFSVREGFILLLDKNQRRVWMTYRGIQKENLRKLQEAETDKGIEFFFEATRSHNLSPMDARVVSDKKFLNSLALPMNVEKGCLFLIDETCVGYVGLGGRLTGEDYSFQEEELLSTLTSNFVALLGNTRSLELIQRLNVHLEERNVRLEKTIRDLTASRGRIEVLEKAKVRFESLVQRELQRTRKISAMDFVLILGMAVILGLGFNFSNPGGVNLIPSTWSHEPSPLVDSNTAKLSHEEGTSLFVDARPSEFYEQSHIRDAVNLPLSLFDFVYMMKLSRVDPHKEIIVYGRNISRLYDEEVALKLVARGHINVKVLSGGLSTWQRLGYPVEP